MLIVYPVGFVIVQWVIIALVPSIAHATAYFAMVIAPLLTGIALVRRGRAEDSRIRAGWYALAVSMVMWALGAFDNLHQELILGHANEMYRGSMLAFNLAAVPIAFVLAGDWRGVTRPVARATDGVMALALGYAFFLYTWEMLTARGTPDEASVQYMVWLLDAQNLFLALGALVRWIAADSRIERAFFRAIFLYEGVYLIVAFVNDHFIAGDPAYGPQVGSMVTVAFALLAALALRAPASDAAGMGHPHPRLVRAVRSTSPMMLAGALLIVSLFVIREDYAIGMAGILIAVIGYSLRTTLSQVLQLERGEILQRERSELQSIAWTDALTGLANRHFVDRILTRAAKQGQAPGPQISVLMIDVDHFKLLNDHYGHPAGDACLRAIAQVLRGAIIRPGDVVARYGGEEFIALVHDADAAGALVVAERLRAAVEALAIENVGSPYRVVTVSVGAASAPRNDAAAAANLVATADRALYDAKHAGRNQIKGLVAGSRSTP